MQLFFFSFDFQIINYIYVYEFKLVKNGVYIYIF